MLTFLLLFFSLAHAQEPLYEGLSPDAIDVLARRHFDFVIVGAGMAGSTVASELAQASCPYRILLVDSGSLPASQEELLPLLALSRMPPAGEQEKRTGRTNIQDIRPMGTLRPLGTHVKMPFESVEANVDPPGPSMHPLAFVFLRAAMQENFNVSHYTDSRKMPADGEVFFAPLYASGKGPLPLPAMTFLEEAPLDQITIVTNAEVTKLQFSVNRISTITLSDTQQDYDITIPVGKEVILAGGAVETARVLLMAGFGPEVELQNARIPVLIDLPVGSRLQTRPVFDIDASVDAPPELLREVLLGEDSANRILEQGADMLLDSVPIFGAALVARDGQEVLAEIETVPFQSPPRIHARLTLLQPQSEGFISVRNSGSRSIEPRLIADARLLQKDADLEALVAVMQELVGTSLIPIGGCEFDSSQEMQEKYPAQDDDDVLLIPTVRGLRLADTSVLPKTPDGNTEAVERQIAMNSARAILAELEDSACDVMENTEIPIDEIEEPLRQRQANRKRVVVPMKVVPKNSINSRFALGARAKLEAMAERQRFSV